MLAEQLSDAGVPVFISDIKGDISGLAAPAALNDRLTARAKAIGFSDYAAKAFPAEFLTLDRGGQGVRLRASVHSFGPILLAKVLELNETQQSVLALAFKYADDKKLPLIDLPDLRALLSYLDSDEGEKEMEEYDGVATATVGVMIRKFVELEQQKADAFFGAPESDVADLPTRHRTFRHRSSASLATGCSTRCAPSRPTTCRWCAPRRRPSPPRPSTRSRPSSPRWGSARR